MSTTKKSLLAIIGLILATTAALAAMGAMGSATAPPLAAPTLSGNPPVTVSTEVVQDKVLKGGDGRVTVSLNLTAARLPAIENDPAQAADLVIVLDRSGSMEGQKLNDARQAVIGLLDQLGPDDRLALVTYSNERADPIGAGVDERGQPAAADLGSRAPPRRRRHQSWRWT